MPKYIVYARETATGTALPPYTVEAVDSAAAAEMVAGPDTIVMLVEAEPRRPVGPLVVWVWLAATLAGAPLFSAIWALVAHWEGVAYWNRVIDEELAKPPSAASPERIQIATLRLEVLARSPVGRFLGYLPMSLPWTALLNLIALGLAAWERPARWPAAVRVTILMLAAGVGLGELLVWLETFTTGFDVAAAGVGVGCGWLWTVVFRTLAQASAAWLWRILISAQLLVILILLSGSSIAVLSIVR